VLLCNVKTLKHVFTSLRAELAALVDSVLHDFGHVVYPVLDVFPDSTLQGIETIHSVTGKPSDVFSGPQAALWRVQNSDSRSYHSARQKARSFCQIDSWHVLNSSFAFGAGAPCSVTRADNIGQRRRISLWLLCRNRSSLRSHSRFDFYQTNYSNLRFNTLQETLVRRCALLHNFPEPHKSVGVFLSQLGPFVYRAVLIVIEQYFGAGN
jgi:hypothetical protein